MFQILLYIDKIEINIKNKEQKISFQIIKLKYFECQKMIEKKAKK